MLGACDRGFARAGPVSATVQVLGTARTEPKGPVGATAEKNAVVAERDTLRRCRADHGARGAWAGCGCGMAAAALCCHRLAPSRQPPRPRCRTPCGARACEGGPRRPPFPSTASVAIYPRFPEIRRKQRLLRPHPFPPGGVMISTTSITRSSMATEQIQREKVLPIFLAIFFTRKWNGRNLSWLLVTYIAGVRKDSARTRQVRVIRATPVASGGGAAASWARGACPVRGGGRRRPGRGWRSRGRRRRTRRPRSRRRPGGWRRGGAAR